LFQKGDSGHQMFVVKSGEMQIVDGNHVFETIPPGGIFGEMALIDGSPRAATARAKTNCDVAAISEKSFLFLVDEVPEFALHVMRTLTDRLRRLDRRM